MKKVLIYTSPARGHLYPMMDIAIKLKEEGYHVFIQTLSGEKNNVDSEGVEHLSISPEIETFTLDDYKEKSPISQIKATFRTWLSRAPYEIEDLRESCKMLSPDLLIIDANTWGAAAFAESGKEPWAMFMPYCLPISSRDTPAFGPGFKPPANFIHRLRDRFMNGIVNSAVREIIKEYNQLRDDVGVPKLTQYQEIFVRPQLVLYRTAEPFDYPRAEMPENILSIGPGLWAPPSETPGWIEEMPKPRILVTVSTEMQNDRAIIETAIDALADMRLSLIITTAALDPDSFDSRGENIRIVRYLPHSTIIPKMDLVITHGGMGTTQRALAAGVPVCVVPWGRDQSETARRVEVSGAGTMLPKKKLNGKNLLEKVQKAMSLQCGAEAIAEAFASAGGAELAFKAIQKIEKES